MGFPSSSGARRFLVGAIVLFLVVAAGALAVFLGLFERSVVTTAVDRPMSSDEIQRLAPSGRYLAAAADCAACHTAPGGAPYAGGLAFAMPVGTLYATNITPDRETGIGAWSRAEFHRAVRDGVGKHGQLYPAMPYVSYRQLTEGDVDAIYAYMMTRAPIRQANRQDSFPFPYVRQFLTFWNLVNLPWQAPAADPARPLEWNHGRYLVDALGHCGECHTPRDLTMGMVASRYLQGARIEGVDAPDITPAGLARLGFDHSRLAAYMRAGQGPQGVMSFGMYDVVHNSTRHLSEADAVAMALYLTGGANAPPVSPARPASSPPASQGRQLYVQSCSGCHGLDGEGTPNVAPPMRTNVSVLLPSPHNLLVAVLQGLPARDYPQGHSMQEMPGFGDLLSDQQIADLANYLRTAWAGAPADVTSQAVASVRADPETPRP